MDKKIFYNGNQPYHIVRKISVETCNPKRYGIERSDESAYMLILQLWRDEHNCDHVLRQNDDFLLCRTIKDAQIIE
tara:strand:- start:1805 stop:2032 length:228 start_codon:yes stop_codon:yes gene_type:complete